MNASKKRGPAWFPASVVDRIVETPHDATLVLAAPASLSQAPFSPGNFVQLRDPQATVGEGPHAGRNMSAAFSLSGCPASSDEHTIYRVTVRRVGERGCHFHDVAKGTSLELTAPTGTFVLALEPKQRLYLLAGGSGVAPFRCFVEWLAQQRDPPRAVHVLHSAKDVDGLLFRRELLSWAGELDWFHYHATCTGDVGSAPKKTLESGRWNQARLARMLGEPASAVVYACGPGGLVEAAMGWAKDLGVPRSQCRREQW